jgi:hypothetical protein
MDVGEVVVPQLFRNNVVVDQMAIDDNHARVVAAEGSNLCEDDGIIIFFEATRVPRLISNTKWRIQHDQT